MSKKLKFVVAGFSFLGLIVIWQFEMINYGIGQAKGQLSIVYNTMPIEDILKSPAIPDSTKNKLILIQEIREYATQHLGIEESENYTTFYDQGGKPSLWVLTATDPYQLKAYEWDFPFLGRFSYKGFFDYEKALIEEAKLKARGYDTNVGVVNGWSTLGWLKDPVMSSMLNRNEGDLANLIIHELTHGTLYVKDSVDFNENLASFVGDKGAESFLRYKFGEESEQLKKYVHDKHDRELFYDHILNGAKVLENLYSTFTDADPELVKKRKKQAAISEIIDNLDTLGFKNSKAQQKYFRDNFPNNTFFMSYLRYRAKLDILEEEFEKDFNSDIKLYLNYLKEKFPSL
jgi:predicted aminopeptidase